MQRRRILAAASAVVAEHGYAGLTVGRVIAGAGVSRETFYGHFGSARECFLAVYEQSLQRIAAASLPAYRSEREWQSRVRAGLAALLEFLEREPALARLVVVEVYRAGPPALELRAGVLARLRALLQPDGAPVLKDVTLPPLAAELLLGSAGSLIYGHISSGAPEPLPSLLPLLMALLVRPYLGAAAAERELRRPPPPRQPAAPRPPTGADLARALVARHGIRVGHRTLRVLELIAERPGMSNRELARAAGDVNEGQMSRLLGKLCEQGVIECTCVARPGLPRAWRLAAVR